MMGLSCRCNEYDGDPDTWGYYHPQDFEPLKTKKRKRCSSCNRLIDKGSLVLDFERFRGPRHEIEENIYGDEVPLASWYQCEYCGEIYLNLTALGYCLELGMDMHEYLKEYHELSGFQVDSSQSTVVDG